MTTITELRDALVVDLRTITGLNVTPVEPSDYQPPCAFLTLQGVDWDETFQRGVDHYVFVVTVVASVASWTHGQVNLDSYAEPSGPTSVKEAIESDVTYPFHVVSTGAQQPVTEGAVLSYITQTYTVEVWANNEG